MNHTATREFVKVPKAEYARLKDLKKNFEKFLKYAKFLQDLDEAEKDIRAGRTIPQEKLFRQLGL